MTHYVTDSPIMNREAFYGLGLSPRTIARLGGALYLLIIIIGLFGEAYVRGTVIVPGDAARTAANLITMESLWRFGIAAELVLLIAAVILAVIFYLLLRPVSRTLALLSAMFNLVAIGIEAVSSLSLIGALLPLGTAEYLDAFSPEQLYGMAHLAVRSHGHGFAVALVFFGCFCILYGTLIFKSSYLPRLIGVLMQIAGISYLVNSFTLLLSPAASAIIFPGILLPAFLGELSLCLWLLVEGVNVERWQRHLASEGIVAEQCRPA